MTALGLLVYNYKQKHISFSYAAGLFVLWLLIGFGLATVTWHDFGSSRAMAVLIMLPLIRPALCSLALAVNRLR